MPTWGIELRASKVRKICQDVLLQLVLMGATNLKLLFNIPLNVNFINLLISQEPDMLMPYILYRLKATINGFQMDIVTYLSVLIYYD